MSKCSSCQNDINFISTCCGQLLCNKCKCCHQLTSLPIDQEILPYFNSPTCDRCGNDEEQLVHCRECQGYRVCKKCWQFLHSMGQMQTHSFEKFICQLNTSESSRNEETHQYWLEQYTVNEKEIKLHLEQNQIAENWYQNANTTIATQFDTLLNCITTQKNLLQNQLSAIHEKETLIRQEILNKIKKQLHKILLCKHLAQNNFSNASIEQILEKFKQSYCQVPHLQFQSFNFTFTTEPIINLIKQLTIEIKNDSSPLQLTKVNNKRPQQSQPVYANVRAATPKVQKQLFGTTKNNWPQQQPSPAKSGRSEDQLSKENKSTHSLAKQPNKKSNSNLQEQQTQTRGISVQKNNKQSKSPNQSINEIYQLSNSNSVAVLPTHQDLILNPLAKRYFEKKFVHQNSIYVSWSHIDEIKITYRLEFGIGIRMGGIEQFKQVYQGETNSFIIKNLQARNFFSTTYRLRVLPIIEANEDSQKGEMSDIVTIQTNSPQSIEETQFIKSTRKSHNEILISFERPGFVTTLHAYSFGIVSWEVKLIVSSHSLTEDTNACLIIGICQKNSSKKQQIIGSTINYGLSRESLKIRVSLDFDKHQLIVATPQNQNGEIYNNLPQGLLFPAFYNKINEKNSLSCLKLLVHFDN